MSNKKTPRQSVPNLLSQAVTLHQQGNLELAQYVYAQVLTLQPDHFDALHLLGVIAQQQGHHQQAVELIERAISANPNMAFAYYNLANSYKALRQHDAALLNYGRVIHLAPDFVDAYSNTGNVYFEIGQYEEAAKNYEKSLQLRPDRAEEYSNLGSAQEKLQQLNEALESHTKAIKIEPRYAEAWNNRGNVLRALHRTEEAMESYNKALEIQPQYAEAYYNRGIALQDLRQHEEALQSYKQAIQFKSDYVEAYNNLGNLMVALERFEEALDCYDKVIAIQPTFENIHLNRGNALLGLRRIDQALDSWSLSARSQEVSEEGKAKSYCNTSMVFMSLGRYEEAWPLYEWRWQAYDWLVRRHTDKPLWLGRESLIGKTVLLHAEQGLGDTIQFCRYAQNVADLGGRVILEVPRELTQVLACVAGVSEVIEVGEPLPDFDFHCPLLSMPLAFQTTLDTIPCSEGYIRPDVEKAQSWHERLAPLRKTKIGLVWNGGFHSERPELATVNDRRNISLSLLAQHLNDENFDFISVQKGDPAESEIRGREQEFWPAGNLHNPVRELKDFSDTAALVANLDLVISVDTSTAHLAAAMGKSVWILNRFDSCWRWLKDRQDSPWYKSVRLYRQGEDRDWSSVLTRVASDLLQWRSALH